VIEPGGHDSCAPLVKIVPSNTPIDPSLFEVTEPRLNGYSAETRVDRETNSLIA
jgi:hypothetical protein